MSSRLPLVTTCCILVYVLLLGFIFSRVNAGAETPYKYLSYGQVVVRLEELQSKYPDYVEVFTAQQRYGLEPVDGSCHSLAQERNKAQKESPHLRHERERAAETRNKESLCEHYFVRLTHKPSWKSDPQRPHVFFSGNLHGDEQVGPMSLMGLVELLLEQGPSGRDQWLSRLLKTRVIVAIPITNPWGYEHRKREEKGIDPNRDFPHGVSSTACMKTMLARAVNEVWREHVFQMAITFHGGMQAIAYEWGAASHTRHNSRSPDETSQSRISTAMSFFGGSVDGRHYPVGRMNQLVYPVRGGMEDWGYSASWDTKQVKPCNPKTYSAYAVSHTQYNSAQLRCFTLLVETSDKKRPPEDALGTSKDLMNTHSSGNGHVPRNIRLALLATDVVEPYVVMRQSTKAHPAGSGIIGALQEKIPALKSIPSANIFTQFGQAAEKQSATFGWDVGGCLNVDRTSLAVFEWGPLLSFSVLEMAQHQDISSFVEESKTETSRLSRRSVVMESPAIRELSDALRGWSPIFPMDQASNTKSHWPLPSGLKPTSRLEPNASVQQMLLHQSPGMKGLCSWGKLKKNSEQKLSGTSFTDSIQLNDLFERIQPGMKVDVETKRGNFTVGSVLVTAVGMTDQDWGVAKNADPSGKPPQTHLARVRTDPSYNQTNNGHLVKGRWHFSSKLYPVIIVRRKAAARSEPVPDHTGASGSSKPSGRNSPCKEPNLSPMLFAVLVLILVFAIGCMRIRQHERRFIRDVNRSSGEVSSLEWNGWFCSCIDVVLAWCSPIVRHNRALLRYETRAPVSSADQFTEGEAVH